MPRPPRLHWPRRRWPPSGNAVTTGKLPDGGLPADLPGRHARQSARKAVRVHSVILPADRHNPLHESPALAPPCCCRHCRPDRRLRQRLDDDTATVRVINASTNYGALDLYGTTRCAAAQPSPMGRPAATSASRKAATTTLTRTSSTTALSSVSRTLSSDYGTTRHRLPGRRQPEDRAAQATARAPSSVRPKLPVFNASPDAGSVDVYISGSSDTLDNATLRWPPRSGAGGSSGSHHRRQRATPLPAAYRGGQQHHRPEAGRRRHDARQGASRAGWSPPPAAACWSTACWCAPGGAMTRLDTDLARVRLVSPVANAAAMVGARPSTAARWPPRSPRPPSAATRWSRPAAPLPDDHRQARVCRPRRRAGRPARLDAAGLGATASASLSAIGDACLPASPSAWPDPRRLDQQQSADADRQLLGGGREHRAGPPRPTSVTTGSSTAERHHCRPLASAT